MRDTIQDFETDERQLQLAAFLGCDPDEVTEGYDETMWERGQAEYLVVTEDEADRLWEDELDNYLEECVYPEMPESMRFYFDDEAWKRDARLDGRSHALGRYDGCEYDSPDGSYVIIRQN